MDPFKDVGPAAFGIVVVVLLQLAQFFFAWRRDSSREAAVRKEDLAAVKKELRVEIKEVDLKLANTTNDIEMKLDAMRKDSLGWRDGINTTLSRIELEGVSADSETKATLEFIKQQVATLNLKVDKLNSKS